MTATIYQSTKFNYAREQYFAVAGGHTLLRLTTGSIGGQAGGAIKTATASDSGAAPVHRDREALIEAMRHGLESLGFSAQYVSIKEDREGRRFGEFTFSGPPDESIGLFQWLAEEIERHLFELPDDADDSGYSDLRDLYDDLCHIEGEPVYLSDGVYLGSDGRLFE